MYAFMCVMYVMYVSMYVCNVCILYLNKYCMYVVV